jgi:ACT domain-containing protein
MNTLAEDARENKALEIIQLVNQGVSIIEACKQIGWSRSAFYQYQTDHPEFVLGLQKKMLDTTYENLLHILLTRVRLLQKLIVDALREETKPADRLAIFKEMEKHMETLAKYVRIDGGANSEAAADVLSGPVLVPGISRFSIQPETPRDNPLGA